MTPRERGLQRGRAAGAAARIVRPTAAHCYIPTALRDSLATWADLYPTMKDDMGAALIACEAHRLACVPDYARFPELRGHADLLRAEREAFREVSGFGELETAYHFSANFFQTRVLETMHIGRWDVLTARGCTNIFIPGGADGVTIADNRDIPLLDDMSGLAAIRPDWVFQANAKGVDWRQGNVSSAVALDDAPACTFPADPFEYTHLIPAEFYEDVDVMIEFLARFNEFWGPGNRILVDRKMRAVMFEKTNCLVAHRKAGPTGAAAVTACAYLDPRLYEHQMERNRRVAEIKGQTLENSLEINYHQGSRQRYRRLTALTEAAAAGKPTIWDALNIVADHAVPYPARVCLAGEAKGSQRRNPKENWSVTQHAAVITGAKQRALYRAVQSRTHPKAVYEYTPKLMLGPGVVMWPEWQAEIDTGRCIAGPAAEVHETTASAA